MTTDQCCYNKPKLYHERYTVPGHHHRQKMMWNFERKQTLSTYAILFYFFHFYFCLILVQNGPKLGWEVVVWVENAMGMFCCSTFEVTSVHTVFLPTWENTGTTLPEAGHTPGFELHGYDAAFPQRSAGMQCSYLPGLTGGDTEHK